LGSKCKGFFSKKNTTIRFLCLQHQSKAKKGNENNIHCLLSYFKYHYLRPPL